MGTIIGKGAPSSTESAVISGTGKIAKEVVKEVMKDSNEGKDSSKENTQEVQNVEPEDI